MKVDDATNALKTRGSSSNSIERKNSWIVTEVEDDGLSGNNRSIVPAVGINDMYFGSERIGNDRINVSRLNWEITKRKF